MTSRIGRRLRGHRAAWPKSTVSIQTQIGLGVARATTRGGGGGVGAGLLILSHVAAT